MKWKTTEEVKEAAKDKMSALKMSLAHHEQGRDCTRGELIDALDRKEFGITSEFCACCKMAGGPILCDKKASCPLYKEKTSCCEGLWSKLDSVFMTFTNNPTPANFTAFQQAGSKICDYIQGVIDAEEAKLKALAKPKLRHGDLWLSRNNQPKLIIKSHLGQEFRVAGESHWWEHNPVEQDDTYTFIANIFDDIAKRGEELAEFDIRGHHGGRLCAEIDNSGDIALTMPSTRLMSCNLDETQQIIDGLQGVLNKAKNKDGKK